MQRELLILLPVSGLLIFIFAFLFIQRFNKAEPETATSKKNEKETRYSLRLVERKDIEDIKDIASYVYGGNDYVYVQFESLYSASNLYYFVLCDSYLENKVVAIQLARIIDDNSTIWCEGLRVHPNWRRQGLATMIKTRTIGFLLRNKDLKLKYKNSIKRVRAATVSLNLGSVGLHDKLGFDIVQRWRKRVIDRYDNPEKSYPFSNPETYVTSMDNFQNELQRLLMDNKNDNSRNDGGGGDVRVKEIKSIKDLRMLLQSQPQSQSQSQSLGRSMLEKLYGIDNLMISWDVYQSNSKSIVQMLEERMFGDDSIINGKYETRMFVSESNSGQAMSLLVNDDPRKLFHICTFGHGYQQLFHVKRLIKEMDAMKQAGKQHNVWHMADERDCHTSHGRMTIGLLMKQSVGVMLYQKDV